MGHPYIRRKRQCRMSCRHLVHIVDFAGGCHLSMKFLAIPTAFAALPERTAIGKWRVRFAEHDVGAIASPRIRFDLRFGIREIVQPSRRRIPRAVILIIAAASGTCGRQHWQSSIIGRRCHRAFNRCIGNRRHGLRRAAAAGKNRYRCNQRCCNALPRMKSQLHCYFFHVCISLRWR